MIGPRRLFTRILIWFFLSLVVLAGALFGLFNLRVRLDPGSVFPDRYGLGTTVVATEIAQELSTTYRGRWNEVLDRYNALHKVRFILSSNDGQILAGPDGMVPTAVRDKVIASATDNRPGTSPFGIVFSLRTTKPTRFWVGVRVQLFMGQSRAPIRATMLAVSASPSGGGLFFDPKPILAIIVVVAVLSTLLWLPMVRSITAPLRRIANAAEQIASGRFDVTLSETREDEIGQLSRSINSMARRLDKLVSGQKRFLGDVAHELASPVARIKLGLGILENKVGEDARGRVQDVIEEAEQMSRLVDELLHFSRAEANLNSERREAVALAELARREAVYEVTEGNDLTIEIDASAQVLADRKLLARAIRNVVRNAARYAGADSAITLTSSRDGDRLELTIRDSGPGVPEEEIDRIFEPFYRPDQARGRETGGTGLGLAIVKSCIEACGGRLRARNHPDGGFEVTFDLEAA
ncbi:MAG: HAMP domain-containing protein [Deltaproteobacteria bacterium]|nr:HAMP domain-containing protein [Deltaproteobacteria bacterium]